MNISRLVSILHFIHFYILQSIYDQRHFAKSLLSFKDLHFDQVYIHDVFYTSAVEAEMFNGIYIFHKFWPKKVL